MKHESVMTLMEHNLSRLVTAKPVHRVQVRWTSMRHDVLGHRPRAFHQASAIIVLDMHDEHRSMVEMWTEENGARRLIRDRTLIKAQGVIENGMLHIDAGDVCRLTIRLPDAANDARLLYAQCPLLEVAGFKAGTFDRPTASIAPAEAIAASA